MSFKGELQTLTKLSMRHQVCPSEREPITNSCFLEKMAQLCICDMLTVQKYFHDVLCKHVTFGAVGNTQIIAFNFFFMKDNVFVPLNIALSPFSIRLYSLCDKYMHGHLINKATVII